MPPRKEISCITNDEYPVISDFINAHEALAAAAKTEYESDPDSAEYIPGDESILVSASNEKHNVELHIDSRLIAGRGLMNWLHHRRGRNKPPTFISAHVETAMQPPTDVVFSCVPSGRHMLDPMIFAMESDTSEAKPKSGHLDDVVSASIANLNKQFEHKEPLPASAENDQRLRTAVQAYIEIGQDPNMRISLGASKSSKLYGGRAVKIAESLSARKPELPEFRSADILSEDSEDWFGKRVFSTIPDEDGRQTTLLFSRLRNAITLNLGTNSGGLPSIIILESLPDAHTSDMPFVNIKNREGRPLSLSRSDRALVVGLALDALEQDNFIEEASQRELVKPDQQVLETCQRITQDGLRNYLYTDPQGYEWTFSIDKNPDIQGGFVIMLDRSTDRGTIVLGHTFDAHGGGYSTMPTEVVAQLYAVIRSL